MLIIGIAGGTGSGKTTVVNQIVNELPETEVGIISQDSYYKENVGMTYEERAAINFDHPRSIDFDLLVQHLKELKAGNNINQPVYSFVTHNRKLFTQQGIQQGRLTGIGHTHQGYKTKFSHHQILFSLIQTAFLPQLVVQLGALMIPLHTQDPHL